MEALLMSLNSKVDTMSAKHDRISAELTAIKMECKALREEFSGVAPSTSDADDKNVALAERTSMKQIFEEMLYELKAMRRQRNESVLTLKPVEVPRVSKLLTKQEDSMKPSVNSQLSSASFPVVAIAFPQGEEISLLQEMEKLKGLCRLPVDGDTLKGKSIEAVLACIPTPPRPMNYSILQGNFGASKLAILITNYSGIELSFPKHYMDGGSIQGSEIPVIRGHTMEVTGSYNVGTYDGNKIAGILSYKIGSTASRLTIQFNLDCNNIRHNNECNYYLGLGFTPDNIPVDAKLFERRADSLPTAEFCTTDCCNNPAERGRSSAIVIRNSNLLAVASARNVDWSGQHVIRVDLIERIPKHAIVKLSNCAIGTSLVEDGHSMLEIQHNGNLESCITGTCGCVVEIENRLNVMLENFSPFISQASKYVFLPPKILPFTREMLYASDESYTEGMFSYDIANTNLQLIAVFRVSPGVGRFAIAFASKGSPVNAASLKSYTVHEPWKTRPYIFANAADGEQVLEFRNLRLTASMTTADKSVLKLFVSAF